MRDYGAPYSTSICAVNVPAIQGARPLQNASKAFDFVTMSFDEATCLSLCPRDAPMNTIGKVAVMNQAQVSRLALVVEQRVLTTEAHGALHRGGQGCCPIEVTSRHRSRSSARRADQHLLGGTPCHEVDKLVGEVRFVVVEVRVMTDCRQASMGFVDGDAGDRAEFQQGEDHGVTRLVDSEPPAQRPSQSCLTGKQSCFEVGIDERASFAASAAAGLADDALDIGADLARRQTSKAEEDTVLVLRKDAHRLGS